MIAYKKTFGIVRLDVFGQEFLLAANMTKAEIEEAWGGMDGLKAKAEIALQNFSKADLPENANAWLFTSGEHAIIILDRFGGSWKEYDTLLHECVHAVRWLARNIRAEKEEELVAYSTTHLFRLCRILLYEEEADCVKDLLPHDLVPKRPKKRNERK